MLDAGNTANPRLGADGELIITAYAETEAGGCGDDLGDFVIRCERLSPEQADEHSKNRS
jgi:hypothetical protein